MTQWDFPIQWKKLWDFWFFGGLLFVLFEGGELQSSIKQQGLPRESYIAVLWYRYSAQVWWTASNICSTCGNSELWTRVFCILSESPDTTNGQKQRTRNTMSCVVSFCAFPLKLTKVFLHKLFSKVGYSHKLIWLKKKNRKMLLKGCFLEKILGTLTPVTKKEVL